jgi:hypothetical protein
VLDFPAVPAVLLAPAPAPAPAPVLEEPEALAGVAFARMNSPLLCDELLDAPPAVLGDVLDAPAPDPLADCRHPVMVTVFPDSLCESRELELVLGVLGVCVDGVDGGCCAPTPTASAALSIVPKMI